jgi:rubrerythrin
MAGWFALLRLAERIEALSAELYGLLAERFRAEPEASGLFLRLECEETQHASRIRLLAARYGHDARLLGRAGAETAFLEGLVARAEEVVGEVRAGGWGNDLDEVKRRLAETELLFCNAHAQFLAEGGHPLLREFFAQLAEQDEAHAQLLSGAEPREPRARSAPERAQVEEGERWGERRRRARR